MLLELRKRVFEAAVEMERLKLAQLSEGNISARDPQTGLIAVTPTSLPYTKMTVDDIVIIDLDRNIRWGNHRPTSETPMHTLILRERPDVGAVVHTHSPYALTFAVTAREIPIVHLEAAYRVGERIPVARHAPPGTEELGWTALEALGGPGGPRACLLQNHGLLAVGSTVEEALTAAVVAEEAARVYLQCLQIGAEPIRVTMEDFKRAKGGSV